MPTYQFVATDETGNEVSGTQEAGSKEQLVNQLKQRGLTAQQIQEQQEKAALKKEIHIPFLSGRVGMKELSIFCRQFATMINAGVPLIRCLDVLEQQTGSYRLKQIIRDMETEIEGGATLSRAMSKYPRVFSDLAVGLVRAGEVGGVLDETLDRLAQFLEKDLELRRTIKASMTYPVLVMVFAVGIVIFLVTYILPKFMKLFRDLGLKEEDFPLPTLVMMRVSNFLLHRWYLFIGGVILLVVGLKSIKATKTGKRYYDMLILRLPVFGSLNHKIAVARFARTLSTLLSSGVPILQAMETVAGTVDNDIISDAILASRTSIREGDTIAAPLGASKMFPPMVVQMITIGEETGQLDQMLEKIADFYESEVDATLESLTSALEPIMIVLLGVVVGFIVVSMFLPLITIISKLSQ